MKHCSCGEEIEEGRTLCDECVAKVNEKAKAILSPLREFETDFTRLFSAK